MLYHVACRICKVKLKQTKYQEYYEHLQLLLSHQLRFWICRKMWNKCKYFNTNDTNIDMDIDIDVDTDIDII